MAERHFLAFWNLENLFDTADAARSEGLAKRLARELKGWSGAVLDRKIANLAGAIRAMDGGKGPGILGVCEVESKAVLHCLAAAIDGDRYAVVHADSLDQRGIDSAFLFDTRRYTQVPNAVFTHFVMRRTYTRDILQASFRTASGRELVLFANHWPSRSGGRFESEPYRMTAGETLAHWHNRVHEERGENITVLAIGDFNDEPFDRSLVDYAQATNTRGRVTRARSVRRFLNLMAPLVGAAEGSYVFDGQPIMLDQILAGRSAVSGAAGLAVDGPATILRPPGVKAAPRPFKRPAVKGGADPDGFSDHHAVGVVLRET
ncbi:endonuclease/exonuclease/phosphatase family protein [Falsiroseomonas sp.]|uniref:endonuclease/exonuclease/phosphatase family protein n=1 Tax=Falsiroseomonas sp. TaxID=2870721 RepID=UPI0035620ADF